MKKILLLIATFSLILFFSCKKSTPEIVHSDVASLELEGVWEHVLEVETEISMNKEAPSQVSGTVVSKSITTLTFNVDQSFSMETKHEFVSYTPKDSSDEEVPLDSMKDYFSQNIAVLGNYISSESLIQYTHNSVRVNEGSEISFEEFSSSNSSAGDKIQTVGWRIVDDELYLDLYGDNMEPELVYTRIQ